MLLHLGKIYKRHFKFSNLPFLFVAMEVPKHNFAQFWEGYTRNFLNVLQQCPTCNDLNHTTMKDHVKEQIYPQQAIIDEMYPRKPENKFAYAKCTLSHQCLPKHCKIDQRKLVFPRYQKGCLSKDYLERHKCQSTQINFRVTFTMI